MRSFIQTISIFIVLGLVSAGPAIAETAEQKQDQETIKKDLEAAKEGVKTAGRELKEAGRKVKEAAQRKARDLERNLREQQRRLNSYLLELPRKTLVQDKTGRILVIPAREIDAKELGMVTEDLSIMLRIFYEVLEQTHLDAQGRAYYSFLGITGISGGNQAKEVIYVDGYGAIFLIKVAFPLSAPPEANEPEQVQKDFDVVWEQTKQEMYAPIDSPRIGKSSFFGRSSEEEYNPQKVESFKEQLIKAFKHAANIRNLEPDNWIVVTITAECRQSLRRTITRKTIKIVDGKYFDYDEPETVADDTTFLPTAVTTIRAKKSDVDAFSKGQLDFDQFRKRTQIFTY